MAPSQVRIDLGTVKIDCTPEEIAATFSWLLTEMRAAVPRLRPDECEVLRKIMRHESGELTVQDVFPEFMRESEGHKTLRRLRAAQFIRPMKTGRWELNEPIEVKPFGRLIWNRGSEGGLFGDWMDTNHLSENGKPAPDDGDEVIDLASPDRDLLEPKAPSYLQSEEAANGDNDLLDVFEFASEKHNGTT